MSEEAEVTTEPRNKGIVIFGQDIMKVECLRGSLLNGYWGAVVGGICGLFYTSNVKWATHAAFGSYWAVALTSWCSCRYKRSIRENPLKEMIKSQREKEAKLAGNEYILPRSLNLVNSEANETKENPSLKS